MKFQTQKTDENQYFYDPAEYKQFLINISTFGGIFETNNVTQVYYNIISRK